MHRDVEANQRMVRLRMAVIGSTIVRGRKRSCMTSHTGSERLRFAYRCMFVSRFACCVACMCISIVNCRFGSVTRALVHLLDALRTGTQHNGFNGRKHHGRAETSPSPSPTRSSPSREESLIIRPTIEVVVLEVVVVVFVVVVSCSISRAHV